MHICVHKRLALPVFQSIGLLWVVVQQVCRSGIVCCWHCSNPFVQQHQSPEVSILVIAGLPANDSQRFVQKFGSLSDAEISKLISGEPEDVQVAVKTLVQAVREGFWATCSAFVDLDDDGDLETCMLLDFG